MKGATSSAEGGSSRGWLILRRWSEILFAGVVGAAIILVVFWWRRQDIARLVEVPLWALVAGCMPLFALMLRLGWKRWGAFTGVRQLASYPPLWIASLFGSGIGLLSLGGIDPIRRDFAITPPSAELIWVDGAVCVATVGVLALASAVLYLPRRPPPARSVYPGYSPRSEPFGSFEELNEWLCADKPVTGSEGDRFGHSQIAHRMAERLLEPRPPAQAVVGQLGSGKTTMCNLVIDALTEMGGTGSVRVVSVELWPYETARAAVEGVIRRLVESLAEEVNVVGLQGISGRYAEAMSAAGGWFAALERMQGIPARPRDSLRAINDVATMIGIRYVVWIEDLERFAGGATGDPDDEKLNPIRALLYALDQLESIAVVTATVKLQMRFDIEKIARYVEVLPELGGREVRQTLNLFRQGCFESAGVIDPADPTLRGVLDGLGSAAEYEVSRVMAGRGMHSPVSAVAALCVTPRAMKQALRACLDIWKRLRGEVDFDDILVLSVIRETQPDVFALIHDNIAQLREGRRARDDERRRETHAASEQLLNALSMGDGARTAVKCLIEFLFGDQAFRGKPQGVAQRNHADYWERFLAVPALRDDERDQPVLQTMLTSDDVALLELLEAGPPRSGAVEHFGHILRTERLVRLLVPLVRRRSEERPDTWPEQKPPGLVALWRMWNRRWDSGELPARVVLEEVKRALDVAIPRNLGLVAEIEEHFVVSSPSVPQLLGKAEREEAKRHCRSLLVTTYQGNDEALSSGLTGSKAPTLLWLCWGLDRVRRRETEGIPFADWPDFAPTVVAAARKSPRVMLPQVAGLVVDVSRRIAEQSGLQYRFDEGVATQLFGDVETVLGLFRALEASEWTGSPEVEAILAHVR